MFPLLLPVPFPALPCLLCLQWGSLWMPTATPWTSGPSVAHPPPTAWCPCQVGRGEGGAVQAGQAGSGQAGRQAATSAAANSLPDQAWLTMRACVPTCCCRPICPCVCRAGRWQGGVQHGGVQPSRRHRGLRRLGGRRRRRCRGVVSPRCAACSQPASQHTAILLWQGWARAAGNPRTGRVYNWRALPAL